VGSPERANHSGELGSFCLLTELVICNIIIWQGKSERSDWFFLGWDFAIQTVSVETVISCVFFVFERWQIQNKHGPSGK